MATHSSTETMLRLWRDEGRNLVEWGGTIMAALERGDLEAARRVAVAIAEYGRVVESNAQSLLSAWEERCDRCRLAPCICRPAVPR